MKLNATPLIFQDEVAECGLACVAMVCGAYGRRVSLADLRQIIDPGVHGASMKDIATMGYAMGFSVKSLKAGVKQVEKLRLPAILHWNLVHYVVLVARRKGEYIIHDPGLGRRTIDETEFSRCYTGLAQEFIPRDDFLPGDQRRSVSFGWLIDNNEPYGRLLATVFVMSLVMQAFVLLMPYGAQLLIDRVALSRDGIALAIGLSISVLGIGLYCLLIWLRSTVVMYLNNCLDASGSERLVAKMFSLPYEFFARRDIGSLLSRFANLRELRLILSQGLAESMVEALLAILMLVGMAVYLPAAAVVAGLSLLVYSAYRFSVRETQMERVRELFVAMGNQNASLIESLHKIETVKANSIEFMREQFWLSKYFEYQNSLVSKQRLDYAQTIIAIVCFGGGYAIVCWLALNATFAGPLSLGQATTILLLLGMFFSRAAQFLDRVFELIVARVHLDSLSEVVHGESEACSEGYAVVSGSPLSIELRRVGFRYSAREPFVFRNVSFTVRRGESVVITGPSGCGKSTLLALILGLRVPTEGEILVDGIPLAEWDVAKLRSQIGSVLQSDRLFFGSVSENVSLFELGAPSEKVSNALEACALSDTVSSLPMREHTVLGDTPMLSGGEMQRLILARALYKRPGLLLLDEASSHLDDETEARVNANLRRLGATRLMIAHRRQTIELADTVVCLGRDADLQCSTVLSISEIGAALAGTSETDATCPEAKSAQH